MELARESTVISVILSVSDAIRDVTSFSYPLQNAIPCSLRFMALFQNSCQNFGLGRLVFGGSLGGGGWRFGAGGGGGSRNGWGLAVQLVCCL